MKNSSVLEEGSVENCRALCNHQQTVKTNLNYDYDDYCRLGYDVV
jgi:hypothetical protein